MLCYIFKVRTRSPSPVLVGILGQTIILCKVTRNCQGKLQLAASRFHNYYSSFKNSRQQQNYRLQRLRRAKIIQIQRYIFRNPISLGMRVNLCHSHMSSLSTHHAFIHISSHYKSHDILAHLNNKQSTIYVIRPRGNS